MANSVHYNANDFPPEGTDWGNLLHLIGRAHGAIARYDGVVSSTPNSDLLLSPLTLQEAVLSSKIEGTNVSLAEVLELDAGEGKELHQEKRHDAEEVRNYRNALRYAAKEIETRSFSLDLLCKTHAMLLEGVRGKFMTPGSFRKVQNWIGLPNSRMETASFVPVAPELLLPALDRWISFVKSKNSFDPLLKTAIMHQEFEAIHPFLDGNGRLGRILIPLFLCHHGILRQPNFYMSRYLEANRDRYMHLLLAVTRDGAWCEWCAFFLEGIEQQAKEDLAKAQAVHDLFARIRHEISDRTRSKYSERTVDCLFARPIFTTSSFSRISGIPQDSAQRILGVLQQGEQPILTIRRKGAGQSPNLYEFGELIRIVES